MLIPFKTFNVAIIVLCFVLGSIFLNLSIAKSADSNLQTASKLNHPHQVLSTKPLSTGTEQNKISQDQTFDHGINMAYKVQNVNPYAALEALFYIVANAIKLVGMLAGLILFLVARIYMKATPKRQRVFTMLALLIIFIAGMLPVFAHSLDAWAMHTYWSKDLSIRSQ